MKNNMKKIVFVFVIAFVSAAFTSCSIDEVGYSNLDQDMAFSSSDGFDGLINGCYENLYMLYGKLDGIGPMEMGTDLWMNDGRSENAAALTDYAETLNTDDGSLKKLWGACYATIALANTAIYYADKTAQDSTQQRTYEAKFLRAFCNFHLVEQFGGVTLNKTSFSESGLSSNAATRNTEEEFYELIVSDLTEAAYNLPETQNARGKVNRKAAQALLAKVWLQRTRLYAQGSAEYIACADSAYKYAEMVINSSTLYTSDASESGSTKCWKDDNNKANQEFLFIEAVDHENGYNPEAWNRGRTAQYYAMKIESYSANFGVNSNGYRYRRDNTRYWRPTLYLLQDCFEPSETTPDTRFSDSFYYKYYIGAKSYQISMSNWLLYGKDKSAYNTRKPSTYTITGSGMTGAELKAAHPGMNYYADNGTITADYLELEGNDDAMGCFTPNWDLDSAAYAKKKYIAVGPNTYLPDGKITTNTYYDKIYPSLRKYSCFKYCKTTEQCLMDIPIIRLTDIYLTAVEATILSGHNQSEGLNYLNAVRKHAALSTNASKMTVGNESMNIEFLMKERARELCGEQWRWYDLKRAGLLTNEYLTGPHKNPFIQNFTSKYLVRPIPQSFLDEISNPEEYGNNGY